MAENGGAPVLPPAAFADTKPHYDLLDGLRGVAALLVVWYHVFEGFQFASGAPVIDFANHGYLAVDFFFILSGFVIGYAYDDRMGRSLSMPAFFGRRLIRLHPMVVMGALIGAVCFAAVGFERWNGTQAPGSAVATALLCALLMLPAVPGTLREVRGNGEMFPLNGPCWSLFFEYIGNILYALLLHRLPTRALGVLAAALSGVLVWFTVADVSGYGSLGVGWTLDGVNFMGGSLRMLVPFTIGLFLARVFKPWRVRGAFWICAAALLVLLHVPYVESQAGLCVNGIFESSCILVVFPLLVWLGASGVTTDRVSTRVCRFLGNLSYPLYIVHYPLMYIFYAWLIRTRQYTLAETWPQALLVYAGSVLLAWLCLKFYDVPVRRFLARSFFRK